MNYQEKVDLLRQKIHNLAQKDPEPKSFMVAFELSEELASLYNLEKLFFQTVDPELTDDEIVLKLMVSGMFAELQKMHLLRKQIYEMGNLELLADENQVPLTDEEREIAAVQLAAPKSIDDYWKAGYTTTTCASCGKRAVTHEETGSIICIEGCKQQKVAE